MIGGHQGRATNNDKEYNESLREHLTKEFGPELATALMSANQFTRTLQDRLATESQAAAAGLENFLTALDDEISTLQMVDERLTHLGKTLSDLLDTRSIGSWSSEKLSHAQERLCAYKREGENLAERRVHMFPEKVQDSVLPAGNGVAGGIADLHQRCIGEFSCDRDSLFDETEEDFLHNWLLPLQRRRSNDSTCHSRWIQ